MKSPKGNNILHLFRQWLAGTGSAQSTAELQDAAANDPFLAEAMDGYEAFPESDHLERVEATRKRLRQNYQPENRRPALFTIRRIAAAVVLLVGIGFLFQQIQKGTTDSELALSDAPMDQAKQIQPVTEEAVVDNPETIITPVADVPTSTTAYSSVPAQAATPLSAAKPKKKKPQAPRTTSGPKKDTRIASANAQASPQQSPPAVSTAPPVYDEPTAPTSTSTTIGGIADVTPTDDSGIFAEEMAEAEAITESDSKDIANVPTRSAAPIAAAPQADVAKASKRKKSRLAASEKKKESNSNFRLVRGLVLSDSGEPLIGANVLQLGSENGTTTDFDGQFSLELPSNAEQLSFAYVGFESQQVFIKNKDFIEVQLAEGALLLDEVVVSQYNNKIKETPKPATARPEAGFQAFKKYTQANLRYPDAARQANIQGKVKLTFIVLPNGRPSDIKVKKSLGYGCDEEAIRLLREGPDWSQPQPLTGNRVKYTFVFK